MKTSAVITLIFVWAICMHSDATPLVKLSYEELSADADVIVLAKITEIKVTETKKFFELTEQTKRATFEVSSVLKGDYELPRYDFSYSYYTGTRQQVRATRDQMDDRSPLKNHLSRLLGVQYGLEEKANYLIFLRKDEKQGFKPYGHRYGFQKLSAAIKSELKNL